VKRFKKASDIKVGVIGYGGAFNMGQGHLEQMQRAGMVPTAVMEIDKSRLSVAEKDFPGIETYSSLTTMLKKSDVDLLAIITPHNTHAKIALQCLNAGRHIVCEKPFAVITAECDKIIATAKKNKVVASTYHNRHWDGCIMQALKTIRSGAIGDVFRIEAHTGGYCKPGNWWRSSKSISGGILYDWGVHFLEYSLQILGDAKLVEVTGYAKTGHWANKTKWKADTNEDEARAIARFDDGRWLSLCISSVDSNPKRGALEITGTKGTYIMDHNSYEVITHSRGQKVVRSGPNPPSLWDAYYQNVADHLAKGAKLVITPEWARRPIHILDLANRSAKAGKAIRAKHA